MIDKNEFEKKQHIELAYRNDKSQEDPNLLAKQDNYFQISNDEISSLMKCYLQKNKDEEKQSIYDLIGPIIKFKMLTFDFVSLFFFFFNQFLFSLRLSCRFFDRNKIKIRIRR
jgi:hypothetical protein